MAVRPIKADALDDERCSWISALTHFIATRCSNLSTDTVTHIPRVLGKPLYYIVRTTRFREQKPQYKF